MSSLDSFRLWILEGETFETALQFMSKISDSQAHWRITIRSGPNDLADLVQGKLIHFSVI